MKLLRSQYLPVFVLVLAACGQVATPAASDQTDELHNADGSQKWMPVPNNGMDAGVDDGWRPVSIKVPPPSSSSSSSGWDSEGSSGSSGSSGWTSSSSSSGYGGEPWGPPVSNDIDYPPMAVVCAEREAAKGTYEFLPSDASYPPGAHVSITRDLTEHRYGDGVYQTSFALFFRTAEKFDDPEDGPTRHESLAWLYVHSNSATSNPDAFAIGEPHAVEVGWGDNDQGFTCGRNGMSTSWFDSERLPHDKATITLTRRDGTGVAGTIDFGSRKLTFDAPYGERYPGEDGICCLK